MKIAVLTANVGNIDEVKGMPEQDTRLKYFYYHEGNLPFPLPNLDNRLKSKYVKIQTHRFLPQYDAYVWLDGRVEILSKEFISNITSHLLENEMAMFLHKDRGNVYDEMSYIINHIQKGNRYLVQRYAHQNLEKEARFYKEEGVPRDYPLYACTVFARLNNQRLNNVFDEWWRRCLEFSSFDQTMFAYCAYKSDLKIKGLLWSDYSKFLQVNKHKIV